MSQQEHEYYEALLMKATDGCLNDEERQAFDCHLAQCDACRTELADFARIKKTTDAMQQRIMADVLHDPIRPSLPTRTINKLGFFTLLAAAIASIGYGAFALWQDDGVPLPLRIGVMTAGSVSLLVFGNVLRLRLRSESTDPYREIDQ